MRWRWLLVLALLVALVIFLAQNFEAVEIKFLKWSFETSRAVIVLATLLVGVIIGWITFPRRAENVRSRE